MIYNYLTEADLQGHLFPKDDFRWTGQTDHSASKGDAEQAVLLDFINSKYSLLARLQYQPKH